MKENPNNPPAGAYLISGIILVATGYLIGPWFWGVLIVAVLLLEFWHKKKYGKGLLS
jgi:hypothetical protein